MAGLSSKVLVLTMTLGWIVPAGRARALNTDTPTNNLANGISLVTTGSASSVGGEERPLPDIPALMHEVEEHEKAAEAVQKNYLYHAVDLIQQLDGHGAVKKTETREYDVFWVEGIPVHKLTKKDGRELSSDEQKKESERIDKRAARAKEKRAKTEGQGKETDPYGNEEVTVSRLLELGSFSNPRRVMLNGRKTIAVDYVGDPKARTRNRMENVISDMAGTVWVDEEDRAIAKIEGHFLNTFKIGAGLLANIQKGTNFSMEQRKVNDEVWLPAQIDGHGTARMLLLFRFSGNFREIDSGYRKFKVTTTILPGMRRPSR